MDTATRDDGATIEAIDHYGVTRVLEWDAAVGMWRGYLLAAREGSDAAEEMDIWLPDEALADSRIVGDDWDGDEPAHAVDDDDEPVLHNETDEEEAA